MSTPSVGLGALNVTNTAAQQRVLAQSVVIQWADDSGQPGGPSMAQIDTFSWRYNPEIVRYWPGGAKRQTRQAVPSFYEVTITGGMVDAGFAPFVVAQDEATNANKEVPKIHVTRVATVNGQVVFRQTFTGGIITSAGGDQSDGNKALTQTITVEFDKMA